MNYSSLSLVVLL